MRLSQKSAGAERGTNRRAGRLLIVSLPKCHFSPVLNPIARRLGPTENFIPAPAKTKNRRRRHANSAQAARSRCAAGHRSRIRRRRDNRACRRRKTAPLPAANPDRQRGWSAWHPTRTTELAATTRRTKAAGDASWPVRSVPWPTDGWGRRNRRATGPKSQSRGLASGAADANGRSSSQVLPIGSNTYPSASRRIVA